MTIFASSKARRPGGSRVTGYGLCTYQQCFLDEVRLGLDAKSYQEINLIGAFPAAVEMARAMVNMKLRQSARAYPTDALKAKPAFR